MQLCIRKIIFYFASEGGIFPSSYFESFPHVLNRLYLPEAAAARVRPSMHHHQPGNYKTLIYFLFFRVFNFFYRIIVKLQALFLSNGG